MLKQKRATRNLTENEFQLNVVYIQLSCVLGSGETVKRESREKNRQLNNKKQKTRDLTNEHFILWDYKLRSNKMLAIFTVSPLTFLLFFSSFFISASSFHGALLFDAPALLHIWQYGLNMVPIFTSLFAHYMNFPNRNQNITRICASEKWFFFFSCNGKPIKYVKLLVWVNFHTYISDCTRDMFHNDLTTLKCICFVLLSDCIDFVRLYALMIQCSKKVFLFQKNHWHNLYENEFYLLYSFWAPKQIKSHWWSNIWCVRWKIFLLALLAQCIMLNHTSQKAPHFLLHQIINFLYNQKHKMKQIAT